MLLLALARLAGGALAIPLVRLLLPRPRREARHVGIDRAYPPRSQPRAGRRDRLRRATVGRSLPGRAVDPLTDQVGVTVVAGVLLDHVHHDPSQRDRTPILA